jgi:hypothetical protein
MRFPQSFVATACVLFAGLSSACGSSSPAPTPSAAAVPAVLPKASIQLASTTLSFGCFTGLCTSLTFPVKNLGSGCSVGVQVVTRAFGSDGNGIQLGVDIPMGLPGASLANHVFRPGEVTTLVNVATFNDVRSAHTAFKTSITQGTDIACP